MKGPDHHVGPIESSQIPSAWRTGSSVSTYTCGVRSLGIVLQYPRQAEVRHFALQGVIDEDVAGGQVTVDVAHVREVLHACGDATQHAHQLEGGELAVVVLTKTITRKGMKHKH